jgi:2-polyprenyl-3-methyl-5-hydroxy-6-metoxy-1,4-benzoquinol methylase
VPKNLEHSFRVSSEACEGACELSRRGSSAEANNCIACGNRHSAHYLWAPDRYHGRKDMYQLVRCSSCSLVWLKNPPKAEDMGEHYGPDYDRSVAAAGKDPRRWRDRCAIVKQYKSTGAVLDLGCSTGGFLAGLEEASWKKYGIEMSAEVAREAHARTGAEVFVGDILDAHFAPSSFDVITCFHVFEHLYHPREVLAKVFEWLKPGGIFFTMMPNIDSAGVRIFKSYWYALELPRHLFHFSPKSLRVLAEAVGLEEVSVTTNREVFIEASTRYIMDELLWKVGIHPTPLSKAWAPGISFRVVRKIFRLTVLPLLNGLASFAGDGESIHALFRKTATR